MGDMSREPSMEEILSSIRRVISRDESARATGGLRHAQATQSDTDDLTGDGEEAQDDVLELTEMSGVDMARRPSASTNEDKAGAAAFDSAELVSPTSAAASRQSIDALAAVLAGGRDTVVPESAMANGDVTVQAMVEAALRPMLKQWLDANLPSIVERIVATEIARITGSR